MSNKKIRDTKKYKEVEKYYCEDGMTIGESCKKCDMTLKTYYNICTRLGKQSVAKIDGKTEKETMKGGGERDQKKKRKQKISKDNISNDGNQKGFNEFYGNINRKGFNEFLGNIAGKHGVRDTEESEDDNNTSR